MQAAALAADAHRSSDASNVVLAEVAGLSCDVTAVRQSRPLHCAALEEMDPRIPGRQGPVAAILAVRQLLLLRLCLYASHGAALLPGYADVPVWGSANVPSPDQDRRRAGCRAITISLYAAKPLSLDLARLE